MSIQIPFDLKRIESRGLQKFNREKIEINRNQTSIS